MRIIKTIHGWFLIVCSRKNKKESKRKRKERERDERRKSKLNQRNQSAGGDYLRDFDQNMGDKKFRDALRYGLLRFTAYINYFANNFGL